MSQSQKDKFKVSFGLCRQNYRLARQHGVDYSQRLDLNHPIGRAIHCALFSPNQSFKSGQALARNKKINDAKSADLWSQLFNITKRTEK